jgi:hypothetical protein
MVEEILFRPIRSDVVSLGVACREAGDVVRVRLGLRSAIASRIMSQTQIMVPTCCKCSVWCVWPRHRACCHYGTTSLQPYLTMEAQTEALEPVCSLSFLLDTSARAFAVVARWLVPLQSTPDLKSRSVKFEEVHDVMLLRKHCRSLATAQVSHHNTLTHNFKPRTWESHRASQRNVVANNKQFTRNFPKIERPPHFALELTAFSCGSPPVGAVQSACWHWQLRVRSRALLPGEAAEKGDDSRKM